MKGNATTLDSAHERTVWGFFKHNRYKVKPKIRNKTWRILKLLSVNIFFFSNLYNLRKALYIVSYFCGTVSSYSSTFTLTEQVPKSGIFVQAEHLRYWHGSTLDVPRELHYPLLILSATVLLCLLPRMVIFKTLHHTSYWSSLLLKASARTCLQQRDLPV